MTKLDLVRKLVIDILYMHLEEMGRGFLEYAYNKLGLQNEKRIMEMRKRFKRKSTDEYNIMYEDIIAIIVEEIFQNGNTELYTDLIDFYLKKFPDVETNFKKCKNNAMKWCYVYFGIDWTELDVGDSLMMLYKLYFDKSDSFLFDTYFLIERTFFCLYCLTYGEDHTVKKFIEIWENIIGAYYSGEQYNHFEWCDIEDKISCMEKIW